MRPPDEPTDSPAAPDQPGEAAASTAAAAAQEGDGAVQPGKRPSGSPSRIARTTGLGPQTQRAGRWTGRARAGRTGQQRGRAAGGTAGSADLAGTVLATLTSIPVILVMAWLLTGLPLLLAGAFLPVPMLLIAAPLAAALAAIGLRRLPGRWPRVLPGPVPERGWTAWWGTAGAIAVAAGFTGWQFAENSPSVIVTRAPGVYLQTGYWIAQHGSLPIPQSLAAFSGAHAGLHFSSTGFFEHGTSVVPAFLSGLPMLLAGGFWVHGIGGAATLAPIFGGLAVLTFGGLTARLAGLQWAPAGALVLGLTLTEQYTSRSSFTETVVQVLLFGGLCLVIDSLTLASQASLANPNGQADRVGEVSQSGPAAPAGPAGPGLPGGRGSEDSRDGQASGPGQPGQGRRSGQVPDRDPSTAVLHWRRLAYSRALAGWRRLAGRQALADRFTPERSMAGLGGLALGLTTLVDIGSLLYLLAVIPFAGVLMASRRPVALPLCSGVVVGTGCGIADGYLLSRPYLDSIAPTMELTGLAAAWLVALTIAVTQLLRVPRARAAVRRLLASRPLRWLPELGALLTVAALIAFAVRPYLQTVRGAANQAVATYVALLQRTEHLPVDSARQYAEDTLYWVIWYVGAPAVLLGGFGAALLVRRCLRALLRWQDPAGAWRNWALPLAIICAGSVAVLWHPAVVPDQPWAARRLVPVVIPGVIICAIWAAAWLTGRARERGASAVTACVVGVFCAVALAVPTVTTTFGIGFTHSGQSGALRPSTGGLALQQSSTGEIAAVRGLCASLPRSSSVVIVSGRVALQFTQVIRGMCDVPAAWMIGQSAGSVQAVLRGIAAAGRHPVLLAARPGPLLALGGRPVKVLDLRTTQDPHELTQPPTTSWPVRYVIWMSASSSAGVGT